MALTDEQLAIIGNRGITDLFAIARDKGDVGFGQWIVDNTTLAPSYLKDAQAAVQADLATADQQAADAKAFLQQRNALIDAALKDVGGDVPPPPSPAIIVTP